GRDEADPLAPLLDRDRLAVLFVLDLAAVRHEQPGEAAEERALARAVAAGDEEGLAGFRLSRHAREHRQPPKAAADVHEPERRSGHGGGSICQGRARPRPLTSLPLRRSAPAAA